MLPAFHKPWALEHAGEEIKLQRLRKVNLLISAVLALPASPHRSTACKPDRAKSWSLSQSAYGVSTRQTRERRAESEGRGTMRQC